MKSRVRDLKMQGDALFSKRRPFLSLLQNIAEQTYPERADFTVTRSIGLEFAAHLMTGYPAMCRRDLGNQIGAMLRPEGDLWFHVRTADKRINDDQSAKIWLDDASEKMRGHLYNNLYSGFVRSTTEADHDYVAFGNAAIQVMPDWSRQSVFNRCWHLRDVAWSENVYRVIDRVHRKDKMDARNIVKFFRGKKNGEIHSNVTNALKTDPFASFNIQHIVLPADDYDLAPEANKRKLPFVSIYIDEDNETILEEIPVKRLGYVIPRWHTISNSQYAYSPAAVIGLSDSRMLQQMTLTLLEAGQKSVDPPLLAVGEVINGGVNAFAGGITWLDADYDERTGEAVRPMPIDRGGFQWGNDREEKIHQIISKAFYLDQIRLPEVSKDMTAYEVQKRWEEFVRETAPLIKPVQNEYNLPLCNENFECLLEVGAFGRPEDMPEVLAGQETQFSFESPLQAAQNRANSQAFFQVAQATAAAMQIDPTVRRDLDVDKAYRDAVEGTGAPSEWLVPQEQAEQLKAQDRQQAAEQAQMQAQMAQMSQGAEMADKAGGAAQKFNQAFAPQ